MAIVYSTALKNARLDEVTAAIGNGGKLEIGTAEMAAVLATITLADPAAPAASGGVLTFTMPRSDTDADATGTAAEARIRTSADADVVTGLTVSDTAGDIVLDTVSITAGQTVTITAATITHG